MVLWYFSVDSIWRDCSTVNYERKRGPCSTMHQCQTSGCPWSKGGELAPSLYPWKNRLASRPKNNSTYAASFSISLTFVASWVSRAQGSVSLNIIKCQRGILADMFNEITPVPDRWYMNAAFGAAQVTTRVAWLCVWPSSMGIGEYRIGVLPLNGHWWHLVSVLQLENDKKLALLITSVIQFGVHDICSSPDLGAKGWVRWVQRGGLQESDSRRPEIRSFVCHRYIYRGWSAHPNQ